MVNLINSRKVNDEVFVLKGITNSKKFLIILLLIAFGQIIIIQFGKEYFDVNLKGLTIEQWLICIAWGTFPFFWRFFLLAISRIWKKILNI